MLHHDSNISNHSDISNDSNTQSRRQPSSENDQNNLEMRKNADIVQLPSSLPMQDKNQNQEFFSLNQRKRKRQIDYHAQNRMKKKRSNHDNVSKQLSIDGKKASDKSKHPSSYASSSSIGNSPYGNYPLYYEYRYKKMLKFLEKSVQEYSKDSESQRSLEEAFNNDSSINLHPESGTFNPNAAQRLNSIESVSSSVCNQSEMASHDTNVLIHSTTISTSLPELHFPFDPRLKAIETYIQVVDSTILDLGSNLGLVGLQMLAMNSKVKVICVERDSALVNRTRMIVECLKPEMSISQLEELCFKSYYKIENRVLKQRLNSLLSNAKKDSEGKDPKNKIVNISNRIECINGDMHYMDKFWKKLSISASFTDTGTSSDALNELDAKPDVNAASKVQMVTCFSVLKWIHLTYGDSSIHKLFKRVYEVLSPGGYFIIDETPWKSYKKRRKASKAIIATWKKGLTLRPAQFPSLLEQLGFKKVADCNVDKLLQHTIIHSSLHESSEMPVKETIKHTTGFTKSNDQSASEKKVNLGYLKRPILVFQKI